MRRIGEEVRPEHGKGAEGSLIKNIRIGTGSFDIIWSRIKVMVFAILFVFVIVMMIIIPLAIVDPLTSLALLAVIGVGLTFLLALMMLLSFAMLYPISRTILKGNTIQLRSKGISVKHQFWISTPRMTNMIPYGSIVEVKRADLEYHEERKRSLSMFKRIMYMGIPPPPGGLYHLYSNKKGLVVIYLDEPLEVTSMNFGRGTMNMPHPIARFVKEVIVDVHPDDQDEFMRKVEEMRYRSYSPKKVRAPPGS